MSAIGTRATTYIETPKTIEAYGNELQTCIDHYQGRLSHLAVLGSLGTGWGRRDSDMDIQIILEDDSTDLETMANLSSWELDIRKRLGKTLHMPNLARHRASIMTHSERSIYMRGFVTSFLLPRVFNEYAHVYGQHRHGVEHFPPTREELQADLFVTLEHKNKGHLNDGSPKRMRRNARDIHRYETGKRHKDDPDMDRLVEEMFGGKFIPMQQTSQQYIDTFIAENGNTFLQRKRESDTLLRTWEKTRREIIESFESHDYLLLWTQGKHQGFGFSPQQIEDLVQRYVDRGSAVIKEKTHRIQRLCKSLTNKPSKENLIMLFDSLNQWIPSMLDYLKTKTNHPQHALV